MPQLPRPPCGKYFFIDLRTSRFGRTPTERRAVFRLSVEGPKVFLPIKKTEASDMHLQKSVQLLVCISKGCPFLVGTVSICRNPTGGAPSARRRALPSRERRADNFSFCQSFFSARVVLVCPTTKKESPIFGLPFFVGGVVPSKSEPNSAVISSIVAVFEPSL